MMTDTGDFQLGRGVKMVAYGGIDGGGTQTTVALSTGDGREIARVHGTTGMLDPLKPEITVSFLADLVREAADSAGVVLPLEALCAGLAGLGDETERGMVEALLLKSGVARRVNVVGDDEIALEGVLGKQPGILLVAGTGCVAFGRAEDGRMARAGGWGMVLGDEGSGFGLGRAGLIAALHEADGLGARTALLPRLLTEIGEKTAAAIPLWAERATKAQIAALAPSVLDVASKGDVVGVAVALAQAGIAARYVHALADRLGPWSGAVPVVFHGGTFRNEMYRRTVTDSLGGGPWAFNVVSYTSDPVAGALSMARYLTGNVYT